VQFFHNPSTLWSTAGPTEESQRDFDLVFDHAGSGIPWGLWSLVVDKVGGSVVLRGFDKFLGRSAADG